MEKQFFWHGNNNYSTHISSLLDKFHPGALLASTDGRFLLLVHIFQTVILILTSIIQVDDYRIISPIISLILILILLGIHIRFMTFYRFWVNLVYGATLAFSCGGFFSCIVSEIVRDNEYSILALVSVIPFMIIFISLSFIRNWLFKGYILAQLDIADSSIKEAFKRFTPLDFDVAAQSFSDDKEIKLKLYHIGYEKHKTSLRMRVSYAMYLLEIQENRHKLHHLMRRHNSKSLWEVDARFFFMYCKNKKREMETTQNKSDKEIIKELGRAKKCFFKIKILLQQIWEIYLNEKVSYSRLISIISTIEKLEDKYETIMQNIFKLDPNHPGALRAYAVFESEIKRNFYQAEMLFNEADIAEDKVKVG